MKKLILKFLRNKAERKVRIVNPYSGVYNIFYKRNGEWCIRTIHLSDEDFVRDMAMEREVDYYLEKLGRIGKWLKK